MIHIIRIVMRIMIMTMTIKLINQNQSTTQESVNYLFFLFLRSTIGNRNRELVSHADNDIYTEWIHSCTVRPVILGNPSYAHFPTP